MNHVRNYFTMAPSRRDHYPAARIAIGVAVPLLFLLAIGRVDLTIYAAFGSFTGIYAKAESYRRRFRHQSIAGALLLFSIGLGVSFSAAGVPVWWMVLATAAVAGFGSLAAEYWGLKPAGSLFFVFGFAATAVLPLVPQLWQALLVAGASAGLSVLLGMASRLLRRFGSSSPAMATAVPYSSSAALNGRQLAVSALQYFLAAGVAGGIATLAGIGHSYWAMVAAVVPIAAPTLAGRLDRAVHREVGTLGGVGLSAFLLAFELQPWHIVFILVGLQFLAELFVMRHYTVALLFITPLALLMSYLVTSGDPQQLLIDRAVETIIGALVGVAVVVLMPDRSPR